VTGKARQFWMVDIVFEHADGRVERIRKVSPVPTRRGAEEYERQLRQSLLNPIAARKEFPTFEQFVNQRWWPVYPGAAGNRPTTVREKEIHLRVHLKPALGDQRLDMVKGEVVDRFFAKLRTAKLSNKSVKNIRATLRRVLASAVEWGVLETMPRLPKVKTSDAPMDFFT